MKVSALILFFVFSIAQAAQASGREKLRKTLSYVPILRLDDLPGIASNQYTRPKSRLTSQPGMVELQAEADRVLGVTHTERPVPTPTILVNAPYTLSDESWKGIEPGFYDISKLREIEARSASAWSDVLNCAEGNSQKALELYQTDRLCGPARKSIRDLKTEINRFFSSSAVLTPRSNPFLTKEERNQLGIAIAHPFFYELILESIAFDIHSIKPRTKVAVAVPNPKEPEHSIITPAPGREALFSKLALLNYLTLPCESRGLQPGAERAVLLDAQDRFYCQDHYELCAAVMVMGHECKLDESLYGSVVQERDYDFIANQEAYSRKYRKLWEVAL